MAQTNTPVILEGDLLSLWEEAQDRFYTSNGIPESERHGAAEYVSNPEVFLTKFRSERHPEGRFNKACQKVGRHLDSIQVAISFVGVSTQIVSAACPVAAPATLVVKAFSWLFKSLISISENFDLIEAFFQKMGDMFKRLSILNGNLEKVGDHGPFKEAIVNLLVQSLEICNNGIEQAKKRSALFLKKLMKEKKEDNELDAAFQKTATAEEHLSRCIETATLIATADTNAVAYRIENKLDEFAKDTNINKRDSILNWLSPLDFYKKHQALCKRVHERPVAGKWLLRSDLFVKWRDPDSAVNKIWYTGKPGAGKSVLASIVIRHLQSWATQCLDASKTPAVAFLYLSYSDKDTMTLEGLLGSVVRQIQSKSPQIHHSIRERFEKCGEEGRCEGKIHSPDLEDIKRFLTLLAANRPLYVVVDAMDECNFDIRPHLLTALKKIKPDVKILVTSRLLEHLRELCQDFERSSIEAHDDDINEYIGHVIEEHPKLRDFTDDIKEMVRKKSGKMFLLAQLHMEAVADVEVIAGIMDVLRNLPENIMDSYKHTLKRIDDKTEERKKYAHSILAWMSCALRPLSIQEMRHAIAAESVETVVEERMLLSDSDITSFCCGLVIVDMDNLVRFVHYSAQDFFQLARATEFKEHQRSITLACMKYLCMTPFLQFDDIESFSQLSSRERRAYNTKHRRSISEKLEQFPFAAYAAAYLHHHFREIRHHSQDTEVTELIQSLVENKPRRLFYSSLLYKYKFYYSRSAILDDPRSWKRPDSIWAAPLQMLHIAVFLGSEVLVTSMIEKDSDVNALDGYGQSALTVAFKNSFDDIAGILLDRGAEVDLTIKKGHVLLLYAAQRDYNKAVEKIVGSAPEHEPELLLKIIGLMVMLLLSIIKLVFVKAYPSADGYHQVSQADSEKKYSTGLDPSLERYKQLLSLVYRGKSEELCDLIRAPRSGLIHEIDLELINHESSDKDSDSWDEYSYDEFSGEDESEGDESEDDESRGGEGEENESKGDESEDDESRGGEGEEDESKDDESEDNESMKESDEREGIKAAFLKTACFLAVESGNCQAVKVFLESGIDVNLRNFQGQSLLHRATARDNLDLVKLLLENNATVDLRDQNGRTALLANAGLGREKVLQLLRDKGADINLTHTEGSHELYEAAVYGAVDVVKFFLKNGTNPSIVNHFGWTPLHGAAANGHLECVELLLLYGAKLSPISDTGKTPLDFVVSGRTHYDRILTGRQHYERARHLAEQRTAEDIQRRRDDIMNILKGRGARTSDELYEEIGREQFLYGEGGQHTHPGWSD